VEVEVEVSLKIELGAGRGEFKGGGLAVGGYAAAAETEEALMPGVLNGHGPKIGLKISLKSRLGRRSVLAAHTVG
jgi:hypothetical protein